MHVDSDGSGSFSDYTAGSDMVLSEAESVDVERGEQMGPPTVPGPSTSKAVPEASVKLSAFAAELGSQLANPSNPCLDKERPTSNQEAEVKVAELQRLRAPLFRESNGQKAMYKPARRRQKKWKGVSNPANKTDVAESNSKVEVDAALKALNLVAISESVNVETRTELIRVSNKKRGL